MCNKNNFFSRINKGILILSATLTTVSAVINNSIVRTMEVSLACLIWICFVSVSDNDQWDRSQCWSSSGVCSCSSCPETFSTTLHCLLPTIPFSATLRMGGNSIKKKPTKMSHHGKHIKIILKVKTVKKITETCCRSSNTL